MLMSIHWLQNIANQVQQRKAIEEKLELKAVEEKERVRKERQTLFNQRKREQAKLRSLEQKMELVNIVSDQWHRYYLQLQLIVIVIVLTLQHKEWEAQTKKLMNFARTKAKPHIYYKPKSHNSATEKKVKETAKVLEGTKDLIR